MVLQRVHVTVLLCAMAVAAVARTPAGAAGGQAPQGAGGGRGAAPPGATQPAPDPTIRTGVLSVNSSHSVHTEAPFGGYKRSGIGREMGMHAVNLYTEVKNVYFSMD